MGECGCNNFSPLLKFEGPEKITYMLEIYPSCEYCNSPAGIVLYAFTKKDMKEWQCDYVPDLRVVYEGTAIPVIDPEVLKKKMVAMHGLDSTEAVACEDGIDVCFKDAVIDQIREIIDNPKDPGRASSL